VRTTRTYTNCCLADWAKFVRETEDRFTSLPDPVSCDAGEQVFRDVVLTASGHYIPSGHRKEYTPGLPRGAISLANQRFQVLMMRFMMSFVSLQGRRGRTKWNQAAHAQILQSSGVSSGICRGSACINHQINQSSLATALLLNLNP
jgi:hypothetical protein